MGRPRLSLAPLRLFVPPLCVALAAADVAPRDLPDPALRVAIGAALHAIDKSSGAVWPASPGSPRQILLTLAEREFLFCAEPHLAEALDEGGFDPPVDDGLSGCEVRSRPRTVPLDLLATRPAVGGVSTVVVGSPAATGRTLADWSATLLHEHVHQMQATAPGYHRGAAALNLASGGRGGEWMLDYPFPYAEAAPGFRALADAAITTLAAEDAQFPEALAAYVVRRKAYIADLDAADARYLEFQLWQEGVARWSEAALVEAAGDAWPHDADWLARHRARNAQELAGADLALDGRAAFYPLGAAEAAMLERAGTGWRARYLAEPFALGPYFP